MEYWILRDTREQNGWDFPKYSPCLGTKEQCLESGDYTVEGHEKEIVVERKGSTSEISQNLFQSRFFAELERLSQYKHSFIVCEFSLSDIVNFPENSGIPKYLWKKLKVTSSLLLKKITETQLQFPTQWIFADNAISAKKYVASLFKRII